MNKTEILNKIEELKTEIERLEEQAKEAVDDEIFLLSFEEYEKYQDIIPYASWWWLRSPAKDSNRANYVNQYGIIFDIGDYVYFKVGGIRPALHYTNLKSKITPSKINPNRFIFNDFPFIIIDEKEELAMAEVPIAFDKFDDKSNDYENSYIRKWLLDWMKGAEQ